MFRPQTRKGLGLCALKQFLTKTYLGLSLITTTLLTYKNASEHGHIVKFQSWWEQG